MAAATKGSAKDMFRPATPVTATDAAIRQIKEAILGGRLKPGDRLPAERELCKTFTISRGSLREALRALQEKGLLFVKAGAAGGAYVADYSMDRVAEPLEWMLRLDREAFGDLGEFRETFEAINAFLAAQRAQPGDLASVRETVIASHHAQSSPGISAGECLSIELRFHQAVALASQNRIRHAIMQAVRQSLEHALPQLALPAAARQRLHEDHEVILRLIERRQSAEASRVMREHVSYFTRLVAAFDAQVD